MRLSGRFVTFLLLVLGICSVIYLSIFLRGASSAPIVGKHGFVVKRNTDQQPQQDDPPLSKVASFFALSKAEVEEIANDTYARPTPWHVDARHPLCEREQVIQGQWERTELDAPPYITPTVHLRCFADEVYKQKPYISYDWKPDAVKEKLCDFTPWSVSRFCKVMHKATILIVGDSLSWEHYASLIQLLGGKTRQGYQHQSKYLNMTISQPVCNNQVRVSYRRDDRLQNLAGALLERPPKYFPEVLVLNRGAHYASDEDLLQNLRTNLGYVKTWLKQCDFYEFKCHFFWRTTVPGHPDCGSFKAPNNNLTEMEQHIANYPYDEKMTNYQ